MSQTVKKAEDLLTKEFSPVHLDIVDESHLHAGHRGYIEGESTHLRVTLVSEKFENMPMIKQHRLVNDCLKSLMNNPVHALALKTIKPSKWPDL